MLGTALILAAAIRARKMKIPQGICRNFVLSWKSSNRKSQKNPKKGEKGIKKISQEGRNPEEEDGDRDKDGGGG